MWKGWAAAVPELVVGGHLGARSLQPCTQGTPAHLVSSPHKDLDLG